MTMNLERQVTEHYSLQNLDEKILAALKSAGKSSASPTTDDLDALDNLHLGGREAVKELSASMGIESGMHLLDVGCGVGGPARYFAERGCHVTGIDLTEAFIHAARKLTDLVHLSDRARFQQGSALEMPFASGSFDAAYTIHVGMNIEDKARMFREVARVLKPGGRFGIFDIMRVGSAELVFPTPWALTSDTSFTSTVADYRHALEAAGFQITHERRRRQFALEFVEKIRAQAASGSPQTLGVHVLMGEQAPLMLKNVNQAIAAGKLDPVELVASLQ